MTTEHVELAQLIMGRTTTKAVEAILAAGYSKPREVATAPEAVEAAAKALWDLDREPTQKAYDECREGTKRSLRREARVVLEAVAPHIGKQQQATDEGPGIAEVLALHQNDHRYDTTLHEQCACGRRWMVGKHSLAAHQAEALTAAGFGRVPEKVAEVVVDSSKVFMVMCQDPEAHARSYNEGYEAAVTQGLADDPTLAGDWLDGRMAEAFAYGWREGRGAPTPVNIDTGELLHSEALQPDFNPYRAEEGP